MKNEFPLSDRASVHLDMIRGLSALAVMVGHVRGLFFVNFSESHSKSILLKAIYTLTGLGHEAVMVFFVLSGFFIASSVFRSFEAGRWSWRMYLINRLTRLQLVLLPALLFGVLWDQVGMRLPQAASLYYGSIPYIHTESVASRATLPIFLGNLFFLQSLFSPSFGSNNPLWSLSYEFWYYMLFPVLLFVVSSRLGLQRRLLYAVVGLALFGLIGPTVGFYFLIWLAGAAVGLGPRSTHLRFPRTALLWSALSALLFVLALAFSRARLVKPEMLVDFVVAAGFTLWLYVLVHLPEGRLSRVYSKVARSLAGFSYTLYLTHFPLVLLLRGWLNGETWWQPGARHLLYGLLLSTVVAAYAYLVARLTEANTDAIRRRISLFFSPRQREVAA